MYITYASSVGYPRIWYIIAPVCIRGEIVAETKLNVWSGHTGIGDYFCFGLMLKRSVARFKNYEEGLVTDILF